MRQRQINFQNIIRPLIKRDLTSRIHKLQSIGDAHTSCFVKREDELSFGISGCKLRKYQSLIPQLLARNVSEALVVGTPFSNNVLGMCQILIEHGIRPRLLLIGKKTIPSKGNLLLTSLFIQKEQIQWVEKDNVLMIEQILRDYQNQGDCHFIIPEGCFLDEALPGALTLALDIVRNEIESGIEFDNIFIEAGTGLTAIALILGFEYLQKRALIHVLILAETADHFLQKLKTASDVFKKYVNYAVNEKEMLKKIRFYTSLSAQSFGSVNTTIFKVVKDMAVHEGFLLDPIYSAKLFLLFSTLVKEKKIQGNSLVIHSGGALTLTGFQEKLLKMIEI